MLHNRELEMCKFKKENAAIWRFGRIDAGRNLYSLVVLVFKCMIPSKQLLLTQRFVHSMDIWALNPGSRYCVRLTSSRKPNHSIT